VSTPLATRTDLDNLPCTDPECEHDGPTGSSILLESTCHPDMAMWAAYRHGELTLNCCRCGRHVITIAVAG
jgi:hypothetical protein